MRARVEYVTTGWPMRRRIGLFLLITVLSNPTFLAAEAPSDVTCSVWNSASRNERLMYTVGYSVGATYAAAKVAAGYGARLEKPGLAREILMYLLPENYRFGAIAAEVDAVCGSPSAVEKSIMTVIEEIAREKNAALIYRQENQEYEEFFNKLKK